MIATAIALHRGRYKEAYTLLEDAGRILPPPFSRTFYRIRSSAGIVRGRKFHAFIPGLLEAGKTLYP